MVVDYLLYLIYKAFKFVVGNHEPLRFNIDSSVYEVIHDFIAFIFFILPIDGLKVIFSIILMIIGFRIFVSLVKTLWDLLPFL